MTGPGDITYAESLALRDPVYIDVRSPGEYGHDHIPGSVNLPIFDNEERSEIGTLYRVSGKDRAVLRGLGIAGGKIGALISEIQKYRDRDMVILCARGGMRSSSLAALLNSLGIGVHRLADGYKGYRHFIAAAMSAVRVTPPLFVLHGLTGAGKTEIIKQIPQAVDLEGMAGHRSSIFGGLGLARNSQKKFESLLLKKITALENVRFAVIEGESRKIGNLHIPLPLYRQMQESPGILIDTPIDQRAANIVKEYSRNLDPDEVAGIVESLEPKIGGKNVNSLRALFIAGRLQEFAEMLLEIYYDPLYRYTVDRMTHIAKIHFCGIEETARQTLEVIDNYLQITDAVP